MVGLLPTLNGSHFSNIRTMTSMMARWVSTMMKILVFTSTLQLRKTILQRLQKSSPHHRQPKEEALLIRSNKQLKTSSNPKRFPVPLVAKTLSKEETSFIHRRKSTKLIIIKNRFLTKQHRLTFKKFHLDLHRCNRCSKLRVRNQLNNKNPKNKNKSKWTCSKSLLKTLLKHEIRPGY